MNFSEKIIHWYQNHKRDLPWRNTSDPYLIWLSEIILQQTRIDQGLNYYLKFRNTFPRVGVLAKAPEDTVLKLWQGLGYYTRARNLHKAAKQIVDEHNGEFPTKYEDVLALPGVGSYTAAAITSMAFGTVIPVVDGNVMRVISRVFGVETAIDTAKGKKEITALMENHIDKKDPGTFNQAVMEFGALYCKPASPACNKCIFSKTCFANKHSKVSKLPTKIGKVRIKKRFFSYFVLIDNSALKTWFVKREQKDIWQNLYEFPLIEGDSLMSVNHVKRIVKETEIDHKEFVAGLKTTDYRHILTHQQINARFFVIQISEKNAGKLLKALEIGNAMQIKIQNLENYPVSRLTERILSENKIY